MPDFSLLNKILDMNALKKHITKMTALVGVAATMLLAACQSTDPFDSGTGVPPTRSIPQLVSSDRNLSLLNQAVAKAGLAQTLSGQNLTVFAPTNAAFRAARIDSAFIANASQQAVAAVLNYHVMNTAVRSADIQAGINSTITTLGGTAYASKFNYSFPEGETATFGVAVNGSRVVRSDISATNGVVHIVDAVIVPPAGNIVQVAQADTSLRFLVAAVTRAGLVSALTAAGPLTVFAPTNTAFREAGFANEAAINAADPAVLGRILQYHVRAGRTFSTNFTPSFFNDPQGIKVPGKTRMLSGDSLSVSGSLQLRGIKNTSDANISRANISTTNGVVHIIDKVLLPQ